MKKYFAAAALLMMMAACGSAGQDKKLEGTTWKLAKMEAIPAAAVGKEADFFTLEFNAADTMVAGRTATASSASMSSKARNSNSRTWA